MKKADASKPSSGPRLKQMKVLLTSAEHAVVATAAHIRDKTIADYMKEAVLEKAKRDAKDITALIDKV